MPVSFRSEAPLEERAAIGYSVPLISSVMDLIRTIRNQLGTPAVLYSLKKLQ